MKRSYPFSQFYLLVLAIVFQTSCFAQSNTFAEHDNPKSINQNKVDKINDLISTYAEYGKFNGSILVAEEGQVIYKKGFGLANMEWDIPNQTDTKFRLASVTKQFTAMLTMQLVSENKLALDVPISSYLPDYPKESGDQINIHHLLSHTSGIPNYTSFPNYREMMRNPIKPAEIVNTFADSTLLFTPGERFNYSNSGYVLLGHIIEKTTNKSIEEVLQEKILTPLKMINTGFENRRDILKNRATGYNKNVNTFDNSNYIDMSIGYTAGGIYSTVEDLFLWDQALYTEKLLPNEFMQLIFEKHIPAWREHYGYGWVIGETLLGNTHEKIKTVNHDGVINGFNSLILRIPSNHSSIILLTNTGGGLLHEIKESISGILYDKTYDLPKKSVAYALLESIDKEGIDKGIQYFETIKNDTSYHLDENEMNMASYQLLQSNREKDAATILQLAISSFPNAFNLYDSYGEILNVLGKKEESIRNYKKSLALNPKNDNAITMLKDLGVEINRENLYLLKTDKSWGKEIFIFPLNFAKDLKYEGTEEAHFPKEWRVLDSPEFWSYVFAWNINLTTELTVAELESDVQVYFDGLAKVVNKNKDLVPPKSIAKFYKKDDESSSPRFTGTVEIFDAFVTNKAMTLNVVVEKRYCEQKKKSILFYRFSPKEFGHEIWVELEKIKLRDNVCGD